MRGPQNFFRCAKAHQLLHDLAAQVPRVFDLAVQLAVGKGASTPFAKLHIALCLEHLFAPQTPGVLGALTHRGAAFDHDWLEPHLCQHQGRKDAARPKAYHHGALALGVAPVARGMGWGLPSHGRCGVDVGVLCVLGQHGSL